MHPLHLLAPLCIDSLVDAYCIDPEDLLVGGIAEVAESTQEVGGHGEGGAGAAYLVGRWRIWESMSRGAMYMIGLFI